MPTKSVPTADLQSQIEGLKKIIEAQSEQARTASAQIAALQAASRRNETSAVAIAPVAQATNPMIPDLIRLVPEFNGNPRNLPRWIESLEEKLEESKKFIPEEDQDRIVPIWIGIIRGKITEKANDALSASHTPLEWNAIKTPLIEYFGDKSDLSTLVSKLTTLKQGSQSVSEFYQTCRSLLAEINAKIMINNNRPNEAKAIMDTYETLMINAFVDGLPDIMSDITRSTRPQSLADAYHVASEQEAAIRRKREKSKHSTDVVKTRSPPNAQSANTSYQRSFPFMPTTQQRQYPFAHHPMAQQRSFAPAHPSMTQQRPFGPSYHPMALQRPFQRFAQSSPNPANQQLAIKQEPKSQTGFRPMFRPKVNMHDQYYDEFGYPPCTSQQEYPYHEFEQIPSSPEMELASQPIDRCTPSVEGITEHDVNFSQESEPNPET